MTRITVDIKNSRSILNTLESYPSVILERTEEQLRAIAEDIFNESQERVPVMTGSLKASGALEEVINDTRIEYVVSYGNLSTNPKTGRPTEKYALEVHENPKSKGYKYLEVPYLNNISRYYRFIRNSLWRVK